MITVENIEDFRADLKFQKEDLRDRIWSVFDKAQYDASVSRELVMVKNLISTKNQLQDEKFLRGEKADPRLTAFNFMVKAAIGKATKRAPLIVKKLPSESYLIIDGNATAQVLMLVGWKYAPAQLVID